jgi:AraC-like DNA-binding protein
MLGLEVGRARPLSAFGLWTDYALGAPTLRLALARLARTAPLYQTGAPHSLRVEGTEAVWTYHAPRFADVDARLHADHVLPLMIRAVRRYAEGEGPRWAGLDYAADPARRRLEAATNLPWRFGRDGVQVAFDAAVLDRRRAAAGGGRVTRLDLEARARIARARTMRAAVEATATLQLLDAPEAAKLEAVAARLGAGPRSLQRALNAEGTSFAAVLDDVRRKKALALLEESAASITEIGLALGYSDPANFTRAFRRWTGRPPRDHRAPSA